MAPRKKEIDVENELKKAKDAGKFSLGRKHVAKSLKSKKAKYVVISTTIPPDVRRNVESEAKIANIPILTYSGDSKSLGTFFDKNSFISCLTINRPEESVTKSETVS